MLPITTLIHTAAYLTAIPIGFIIYSDVRNGINKVYEWFSDNEEDKGTNNEDNERMEDNEEDEPIGAQVQTTGLLSRMKLKPKEEDS